MHKNATVEILSFIDSLQDKFPAAFPHKPYRKVPLKVDIREDLFSLKDDLKCSKKTIKKALSLWCFGKRYYSCLKEGSPRFDLNGNISGYVKLEDVEFYKKKSNMS